MDNFEGSGLPLYGRCLQVSACVRGPTVCMCVCVCVRLYICTKMHVTKLCRFHLHLKDHSNTESQPSTASILQVLQAAPLVEIADTCFCPYSSQRHSGNVYGDHTTNTGPDLESLSSHHLPLGNPRKSLIHRPKWQQRSDLQKGQKWTEFAALS